MKHIVIDGNNYVSIALFKAKSNLEKAGIDLETNLQNAVKRLFFQMLSKLQRTFGNTALYYIVWDDPNGSKWRKSVYSDYKGQRSSNPYIADAMKAGNIIADELLITNLTYENAEADDVIYALCKAIRKSSGSSHITVVSRDQDMLQIAQEGFADDIWDPVSKKSMEIPSYDIVLYKCLVGDSSDNLPGIPGIGPKRASSLLECGVPENMDEAVTSFKKIIALSEFPLHEDITKYVRQLFSL